MAMISIFLHLVYLGAGASCLDTVACLESSPCLLDANVAPLQFTYRIGKVEHLRVGRLTHAPYLWLTFVQNRKVGTISTVNAKLMARVIWASADPNG